MSVSYYDCLVLFYFARRTAERSGNEEPREGRRRSRNMDLPPYGVPAPPRAEPSGKPRGKPSGKPRPGRGNKTRSTGHRDLGRGRGSLGRVGIRVLDFNYPVGVNAIEGRLHCCMCSGCSGAAVPRWARQHPASRRWRTLTRSKQN